MSNKLHNQQLFLQKQSPLKHGFSERMMANEPAAHNPNGIDDGVDEQIYACLSLEHPRSFFLYAGAGSGKTRSLVNAIDRVRKDSRRHLLLQGRRIAVITYTNAASDEITRRLQNDALVAVSTIHSFSWALIKGCTEDIRIWLRNNLIQELADLKDAAAKGRPSKAAIERERSIANKTRRLAHIETVKRFAYSPKGDYIGRDSLTHSEVIGITSDLLNTKPTLQGILVSGFPILFIDESQDTNKHLMNAFLKVQEAQKVRFTLGLFGDMMQRIYSDGKAGLAESIPDDWAKPVKKMNHRCPKRVVTLINRIRAEVDQQVQTPRTDRPEGFVRLFIVPNAKLIEDGVEGRVAAQMQEITADTQWTAQPAGYKTLTLEHLMAARRGGFDAMFQPLYSSGRINNSLIDGEVPGLRLFSEHVLPVKKAAQRGDEFSIAAVLRTSSPLLHKDTLAAAGTDQIVQLRKAKQAVADLMQLWEKGNRPSFQSVLECIWKTKLFAIPESIAMYVADANEASAKSAEPAQPDVGDSEPAEDNDDPLLEAWRAALQTPFDQIEPYAEYVSGKSRFGTHQGVKGLEFPRVMVVISDAEAKGFMFSYDKLFGAKEKSATDIKNEGAGEETTIDRTRRLFYVTCSRAESSLAIVAYSDNPAAVKARVLAGQWFDNEEIVML